jgi:penicillin V acylase-like amidase (Ntn superfamily)
MQRSIKILPVIMLTAALLLLTHAARAIACSRILLNDRSTTVAVSRSMDWDHHFQERLIIYPRGMKVSGCAGQNSAAWTSKYGSAGVIPYGFFREKMAGDDEARKSGLSPLVDGYMEGINEKGLSCHLLYLGPTRHEVRDRRPGVNYARLPRYFLDNYVTVDEAVKSLDRIQVVPMKVNGILIPSHYAMEDSTGDSAIIEFVDGAMKVYHGREYRVMTNDPEYCTQLENLKSYKAFGGSRPELPGGVEPDDRFIRASVYLKTLPEPRDRYEAIGFMFSLIRNVSVPFGAPYRSGPAATYPTWWTSATDLTHRVFYFDWVLHPNVVWIELGKMNFSEGQPMKMLDPADPKLAGDVTGHFTPVHNR